MKLKKHSGESIIEVLAAITILSLVMTGTFLMLTQAMSLNRSVRDRVIAINIAREGIEAVRNIRDTNWLKYSGDRRKKWLCQDVKGGGNCNLTTILSSGEYTVDYDSEDNRYYLMNQSQALDLSDGTVDTTDKVFRLYKNTTGRLAHDNTLIATKYYRQIKLEIEDGISSTLPGCSSGPQCKESKVIVTSTVEWMDEGNPQKTELVHHLYDFYERTEY